ncbi:unnamed protein product [Malus baccata var. baccata]|uniref:Uncharacterized protein n=1 Tax=Malus domestica TaxID=3750 RepID=A0A498KC70_MALDO|nr:hypothetical protein DVH24_017811 [Malus domestica]
MDTRIQPPLVDTTACLCRVDAGLKSVAGAKKYVPGAKLCLQPDTKSSIHPTRSKPSRDGCKLRVYDEATDSWSKHIDSKMHLGNSRALEAASLVPLNGKLCIVRNNMSISLVDVSNSSDVHGESAEHLWETIAGKGQFKTLVTNLWSSLAGRGRLKSHIVHCQVLQV